MKRKGPPGHRRRARVRVGQLVVQSRAMEQVVVQHVLHRHHRLQMMPWADGEEAMKSGAVLQMEMKSSVGAQGAQEDEERMLERMLEE